MSSNKKWLILGGSGQLGMAMKFNLNTLRHQSEVHVPEKLDLREFRKISDLIMDLRPDYIVNCAAWTDVRAAESHEYEANLINGQAVRNIGKAARASKSNLIHVSTDYVFSGDSKKPYTEDAAINPINAYGRSKVLGESLLGDIGAENFYIIRTAWLYGKYRKNFIKTILNKFLDGEQNIQVVDDQLGSPTNVLDLAQCIIDIAESNSNYGTYHVANTGVTSWFDFAKAALEILELETEVLHRRKTSFSDEISRPQNSSLDSSKWNSLGLTQLRSWQDALESSMIEIYNQVRNERSNGI
jgi:dTDP-4-dehydrorhamnose reductase